VGQLAAHLAAGGQRLRPLRRRCPPGPAGSRPTGQVHRAPSAPTSPRTGGPPPAPAQ
jgi:hypothetical protein